MARFSEMLGQWTGSTVHVINPESYTLGQLGDQIKFESYDVVLVEVADDYVQISFTRLKKGAEEKVDQFIPLHQVKRVSMWGDQRFIQI
jgi:hypothetical protein